MWYRQGTVTVTNGSNVVTGAGTDFISNAAIGDAFIGPDGRSYEIAQIVSATDLRLVSAYQAATGGGQSYAIQPTQSFARDLALAAAALLNTFAYVRDGVGQGIFANGTVATPAVRFAADQDTGIRRFAENMLSVVAGGVDQVFVGTNGLGINYADPKTPLDVVGQITVRGVGSNTGARDLSGIGYGTATYTSSPMLMFRVEGGTNLDDNVVMVFRVQANGIPAEAMRLDAARNLLVGTSSGPCHTIARGNGDGVQVLNVSGLTAGSAVFFSGGGNPSSDAACAIKVAASVVTGRSINAGGTVNASGADYAEYMVKSSGCGIIAKGDVCGVDRDGKLTRTWADAISFVVKSTDPSLVGGDTWAAHLPARPEPVEDEADDAFVSRMAEWEGLLEQARLCVDRIAFCGQVPCNVSGDFEVGDYIVAVASGAGIKAVAMKLDDMTIAQYARRIGKVWAIRGGRAWIDVQHG